MKLKSSVLFLALFSLSSPDARALVATGNGNYFISFSDLEHEAPLSAFQLKMQRSYNSRSQFRGAHGYGWGSGQEAYGLPSGDGSFVIQENGGGDKTRFSPQEFSKAELTKQVDRLVETWAKQEKAPSSKLQEKRAELMADADARDNLSRSLGIFPDLPIGTKLYSTQRGDKQVVSVIKGGFVREYGDGKQELFNVKVDVTDQDIDGRRRRVLKGVLKVSRLVDPVRKAQVFYEYDKKGRLTLITDKKTQVLRLRYTDDSETAMVAEVTDAKGRRATYKYCETGGVAYHSGKKCGAGDLVESRDAIGGVYTYQYDALHNLTRLGFPKNGKPNQEFEEIAYWPVQSEGRGGVRSVKNRNGTLVEYKYWQDPKDADSHYRTELKTVMSGGRSVQTSYEYFEKARADGSRYRYKMVAVVDGEKTETIYNECCGQPLQIQGPEGKTKFEYFEGTGLPKERDSPIDNVRWEYHPKFHGKITKVTVSEKANKAVRSSEFQYDEKNGQLAKARTSDGKGIVLMYDGQGRISYMVDQDKRKITFKYTNGSKPAEITQDGVGSIHVAYDKSGNIADVRSKGGRQIAISVAAAFQNLLEIIKPAGIQPI